MPPSASEQSMSSTYSFPSYIFDSHTRAASTPQGLHDTVNSSCVDPTTLRWEVDSKDERLSLSAGLNQSIPTSNSSRSSKSQNHHLLEVSEPDRLGSLSPLSEYIEIRGVPVRVVEGDLDVEIEGLDTELALLDDQHNESLINFSFSDWSAASNISQKSFHSRFLKSLQPLPPLELRVATILLDPQLSPLNKTKSRPSEPDVTKSDQYDLAKKVEVEVRMEEEVEVVGMDSAPCLRGPRIDCRFWGDDNDNDNGDNKYATVCAVENDNSNRNHHVVSPRNECNSRIFDPMKNTYSMKIRADDSELDSSIPVTIAHAEMNVDADVLYQESCMYDCPLPQSPVTPLQMYSLMPVRADMLSNMTAYSQLDGDNSSILNLLEWAEYNTLVPLPPPPNSLVKESQKIPKCLDESMKWNDTWNTDKSTNSQSNLSCMRYDKLPSSLDTSNLSDAQPLIWNDIAPSMSSNTSSYPEDIISATSSRAVCVRILTDKSSPRAGSCCRSDDNTICVDRKNRYRDTICFQNDDNPEVNCIPVSQATFVRALVTTLVTGFQSIAVTSVQPSMPAPPCHEDNYYDYHGGDTYNTTLYGGRSALELTAFSCHLVNTFRADVCTALEVYDLLLAELLSHTMTSSTAGKYIESKSNPFDLFRGDRLDVMTKNLNATRVLMVKVSQTIIN